MGWMHFMPIKKVERFFVRNWFLPNSVPLISIRSVLYIIHFINNPGHSLYIMADYLKEKLAKRITFGGGNFCGTVTQFFLVRVLRKFALGLFFCHTFTIVVLLCGILPFVIL